MYPDEDTCMPGAVVHYYVIILKVKVNIRYLNVYSVSNFPLHLLTIKRAFYVRYDVHAISSANLFMKSN